MVGLKICFEEPSDKISGDIGFRSDTCMKMSDNHEFSAAWKRNMNDTNLYQFFLCIYSEW